VALLGARLGGAGADVSLQTRPNPRWPAIDSFDPNTVSAGELLRFGLSKTQTARFLARQEQPGGFSSVEDLDELRGFPAALRNKLKAAARISA
jgi:Helix-hairpin-helix motif